MFNLTTYKIKTISIITFFIAFNNFCNAQADKTITAFNKSIALEIEKKYSESMSALRQASDTNSYHFVVRLAWLQYKKGLFVESIKNYNKAIKLAPDAIEPKYGFGYPAYESNKVAELISQDNKILEIDSKNKTINYNLATVLYYEKKYSEALPLLEKLVKLYPFDYNYNLLLGWTYVFLKREPEGEKYFNVVLLYSPTDASAIEGLTYIKKTSSNSTKLISALTKSYEKVELATKADYNAAITILNEAYDKSSYFINYRLGWLHYYAGLHNESVNYFNIADGLKPESIEAKIGKISPLEYLNNADNIRATCETILKIDSKNTTIHYRIGLLDYYAKDYVNAMKHFELVNKLYPSDIESLLMLGWTNMQLGNKEPAKVYFKRVLCYTTNNESALKGLNSL